MKKLITLIILLITIYSYAQDNVQYNKKRISVYDDWIEFEGKTYDDGPNCFNTSLRFLKIQNQIRYVDTSEFDNIIKRSCKLVKEKDLLASIDVPVLAVVKESTGIMYNPLYTIHSFSYFRLLDRSISKKNWKSENSIYIKSLNDELVEWDVLKECIIYNEVRQGKFGKLVDKKDFKGCKRYIQYYKCVNNKSTSRKDINKLSKRQKELREKLEMCLLKKEKCDLGKVGIEEEILSREITNLRIQIEKESLYSENPYYKFIRDIEVSQISYHYQIKLLKGEPII